jgi:hypothetical protein
VAAVAAVVGEDVDIGAAAAAGPEAALEQIVARGTAAEQARSSSPLLADAMLTHERQLHPRGWGKRKEAAVICALYHRNLDDA